MGFVSLDIRIYCSLPKSGSRKKRGLALRGEVIPTHCDVDNCVKGLSDEMNGIIFIDDRFINESIVRRQYTDGAEKACVTISLIEHEGIA